MHGFRRGSRLIQQRRVRDLHAGEVDDHGLEIQQGFQTPLRDLRLIRRIGGVPTRVFQDVALNHARYDGVVIAHPDIRLEHLVLRRDRLQFAEELVLLQGSRQAQSLWQTDAGGNGFGDQLVQGADADTLEHGVDILRSRTQMAGGKRTIGHDGQVSDFAVQR